MNCPFEECDVTITTINELSVHVDICDYKIDKGWMCKRCIKTINSDRDALLHLESVHIKSLEHGDASKNDDDYNCGNDSEENSDDYYEESGNQRTSKRVARKNSKKGRGRLRTVSSVTFLARSRNFKPGTPVVFPAAHSWALQFCKENFSSQNLFPSLKLKQGTLEKLGPELIAKYLPKLKYSACVERIETQGYIDPLNRDLNWKRYKLFEADCSKYGTLTIFCGGPILAMAWLPTPHQQRNCNQIIAVSVGLELDNNYKLNEIYLGPQLIQFWNCGVLEKATTDEVPKLEFCIAHDYGIVWCLEWCPSGCYNSNLDANHELNLDENDGYLQRLGLLAVGSTDSNIYIYAVSRLEQNRKGKIFKPKPVLKLTLETQQDGMINDKEPQVTKLSWSKASGHQFLAAGYGNGIVAIFNLNETSSLLKKGTDQNGIETIMPYKVIRAHFHMVTALNLYHLNNGCRWLMTASVDRVIKHWDLENPEIPVPYATKSSVTDGVRLNHWINSMCSLDDCTSQGLNYTGIYPLRNYCGDHASIMYSNSTVSAITGSEWSNGFIEGNIAGELKGVFPHQLFICMDSGKTFKTKRIVIGYARLVEKHTNIQERLKNEKERLEKRSKTSKKTTTGEPFEVMKRVKIVSDVCKPEPFTYDETQNKYGLVFCDIKTDSVAQFASRMESYTASNKKQYYPSRPNIYPLQAVKKVAFNPNRYSFTYLASGYQAGFIRISQLKFLQTNNKNSF